MRHPLPVANLLIGVGIVLLTESGLGLVLIPAVLIAMYRLVITVEDAMLSERFGGEYADRRACVPALPWPTLQLPSAAPLIPWRSVLAELPFVATTLLLAVLADASELLRHGPR